MPSKKRRPLPLQARLLEVLEYDPSTSLLRHRKRASGPAPLPSTKSVRMIRIDGVQYPAHRVIWKMHHGTDPDQVDHWSRDRTDNSVSNLRDANQAQNRANSAKNKGRTLPKGVYPKPYGCFEAAIVHNKKRIYLGLFRSAEAAQNAYAAAAEKYHGEFARAS